MKLTNLTKIALLAMAGLALATPAAQAAVTYNEGDLILGFHSSTGSENLLVNLGAAATYRDATTNISIPTFSTLGADLTSVFGSGWATDANIFWGIGMALAPASAGVNGDVGKTNYTSRAEPVFGTQASTFTQSNTNRGTVAGQLVGLAGQFASYTAFADSSNYAFRQATTDNGSSNFSVIAPNGFGLGSAKSVEANSASGIAVPNTALDLFRVSGSGTGTNTSTYEGSFTISNTGVLSYSVAPPVAAPEPSRALLLGAAFGAMVLRRRRLA